MSGFIREFSWTDKPTLSKECGLAIAVIFALMITVFKLKRSFHLEHRVTLSAASRSDSSQEVEKVLKEYNVKSLPEDSKRKKSGEYYTGAFDAKLRQKGKSIIDRPLFDGLMVSLKGVLASPVSSREPDSPVKVQITGVHFDDTPRDIDLGPAQGAEVLGLFFPDFSKKRITFSFSEMTSKEGISYAITGYAVDSESTLGIAADYSSGLTRKLIGLGLNRAIPAADQLLVGKLFPLQSAGGNFGNQMQRAIVETNHETATHLSSALTEDLRKTPDELSLPVGTPLIVKLRTAQTEMVNATD